MWAAISDCDVEGRRERHVHATFTSFVEAKCFAQQHGLTLRKVADEAEARSLEITNEYSEWDQREDAWNRSDYEREQGYLPYGR
jgi:hypothetical protein